MNTRTKRNTGSLRRVLIQTLFTFFLFFSVSTGTVFAQDLGGVPTVPTPQGEVSTTQAKTLVEAPPKSDSCSIFWGNFEVGKCMVFPLMTSGGAIIATAGVWFLKFVGFIFDFLVLHTIIQFADTIGSNGIRGAINTGWSVFRDLSNILIIGMFVFIAISTILGIEEYGYKKLIARVLIVAVLINFSLLFTEMIIDGSNFTAYQFYKSIAANGNNPTDSTNSISEKFLRSMKMASIEDTYNTVKGYSAPDLSTSKDSGWAWWSAGGRAFIFGMMAFLFLVGMSFVLLYGAFLIIARAVLLILLMLTSSLAFATYLIPSYAQVGWSRWWQSLLQSAVFAPILMLSLFVSKTVISAADSVVKNSNPNATIGGVIGAVDPYSKSVSNSWSAIFVYMLGIGLLYASFKLSSTMASSFGTSFAKVGTASLGNLGSKMSGFLGRNTVGRASEKASDAALARMRRASDNGKTLQASMWRAAAKPFTAGAKSDFGTKGGPGGIVGARKKRAEEYAKRGKEYELTKGDKEKMREEARADTMKEQPHLAEEKKSADAGVAAAQTGLAEAMKSQTDAFKSSTERLQNLSGELDKMRKDAAANPMDTNKQMEVAVKTSEIEKEKSHQKAIMNDNDQRIKNARAKLQEAQDNHSAALLQIDKAAHASGRLDIDFEKTRPTGGQIGKRLAEQRSSLRAANTVRRSLGWEPPKDKLAEMVEPAAKKMDENKKTREVLDAIKKAAEGDDHGKKAEKPATKPTPAGPAAGTPAAADAAKGGGGDHP